MNNYLNAHPALRSALRVAAYAFLASFSLSLMGWLGDVSAWASNNQTEFPSIAPLGKALASAMVASLSGLFSFLYNRIPSTVSATYPKDEG